MDILLIIIDNHDLEPTELSPPSNKGIYPYQVQCFLQWLVMDHIAGDKLCIDFSGWNFY